MNLRHLNDQELNSSAKRLAQTDRKILLELLHHLREVERRRLFSKLKYKSLFQYVIEELKYPEDQAHYRISAMRLMLDVPQVEEKIATGALSLTNLVLAKTLFAKEQKAGRELAPQAKLEVLGTLENQSIRSAQKIVGAINPDMKPKKRTLDFASLEDEALREKLTQVKGLLAHSHPDLTLTELLHLLCDRELARKSKPPVAPRVNSLAEVRRQVWKRGEGKCRNCGSTYAVQEEHIIPRAVGGPSTLENMCLLCRSCNQRSAIEYFGLRKMGRYLKSPSATYSADALGGGRGDSTEGFQFCGETQGAAFTYSPTNTPL